MVHKAKENQAKPEGSVFTLEELNLRPSASRHTSKPVSQKSVLTVVKHKNSTRVAIDQDVIEKIGSPERVQIALNHVGVAIGVGFTGDENYFPLRKSENKAIIYSSPLVTEMTETFELDFSNVSSVSFQDAEYLKIGSQFVAFVKMIRNEPKSAGDSSNYASITYDGNTEGSELELDDETDGDSEDAELELDDGTDGDSEDAELELDDGTDGDSEDAELELDEEADGDCEDTELDGDADGDYSELESDTNDWTGQDSDEYSNRRPLLPHKRRRSR